MPSSTPTASELPTVTHVRHDLKFFSQHHWSAINYIISVHYCPSVPDMPIVLMLRWAAASASTLCI